MKKLAAGAAAVLVFVTSVVADGQLAGRRAISGCIGVMGARSPITATGKLSLRHMPGPPNFESVGKGDKDMPTLILTLPAPACIDDGGDFADPKKRFNTVHIWTSDAVIRNKLTRLIGKRVVVKGNGYAADNAMHFAPLVLEAKAVIAQ